MTVELHLGDCLEVMRGMPDKSVDTIITDPPYGLSFMGKDWDRGVPGVAFWREALRVAKPGAMMLAMGGTRTFHRLVVAIEDAGWEVRDSMAWLYGSGFPKSYDISKGIEAKLTTGMSSPKAQRKTAMGDDYQMTPLAGTPNYGVTGNFTNKDTGSKPMVLQTEAAQLWHGWGTALKPAMELICVAMKPIDGTYVNNALTWGVAGFWIDGGRVGTDEHTVHGKEAGKFQPTGGATIKDYHSVSGRFPANVIHDGSDEVVSGFPETGHSGRPIMETGKKYNRNTEGKTCYGKYEPYGFDYIYYDSGSAARFFYCAKASRSERNAGLEGMEEKRPDERTDTAMGTFVEKGVGKQSNHHPTVKPLALMRYLARLTKTPTGGVVLDPFMGSGTTGMAAVLEGRNFIGIEIDPTYFAIAEKRIKEAQMQPRLEFA